MNKTVRMIALTGAAVAATLSLGVAPASATPAGPASASTQADHDRDNRDNDRWAKPAKQRFIGYYRTARSCVKVGQFGRIHKKWSRFDCDQVRRGIHRNQYSLTVSSERRSWHR